MDLDQALQLVWDRSAVSSQSRVAEDIGVHRSALSRWKHGERPEGELREKLFAWVARVRAEEAAPLQVAGAVFSEVAADGGSYVEIARISGYVEAVRDMVLQVASRQTDILGMLQPWVLAESRAKATVSEPGTPPVSRDEGVADGDAAARVQGASADATAPRPRRKRA